MFLPAATGLCDAEGRGYPRTSSLDLACSLHGAMATILFLTPGSSPLRGALTATELAPVMQVRERRVYR